MRLPSTLAAEFELTLQSLGTPRFREVYAATLEGTDPIKGAAYSVAYIDGVITALVLSGVVGLLGAVLAWFLLGRPQPVEVSTALVREFSNQGGATVLTETVRVLEPGGRVAVNVANLGRKPYLPLNHHVAGILQDLGLLLRGEIVWQKAQGAGGSCAWGSSRTWTRARSSSRTRSGSRSRTPSSTSRAAES